MSFLDMLNQNREKEADESKEKARKPRSKKGRIIIGAIILVILLFVLLAGFFTDWMWFRELGYTQVFFKKLFTQIAIGVPTFVIVTFLIHIFLKALKKNYYEHIESRAPDRSKSIGRITWALSVIFGAAVTYGAVTRLWFLGLQFAHSQTAGKKDPLFGLDASFYLFKLDFIKNLNNIIIAALFGMLILSILYYGIIISTRRPEVFNHDDDGDVSSGSNPFAEEDEFDKAEEQADAEEDPRVNNSPFGNLFGGAFKQAMGGRGSNSSGGGFGQFFGGNRGSSGDRWNSKNIHNLLTIGASQLSIVVVVLFIMIAIHFFLAQFELLHADTGTVYGAAYRDVHITLWMYRVLIFLSLVAMVISPIAIRAKRRRQLLIVPVIMVLVGIIGTGTGMLVQNFIVSPDEIAKESPYIERNIDFTQFAYNLDNVEKVKFSAENDLTSGDITNNDATISNIRINDYLPAQTFYNQTQSIRQYYTFKDVDVDRYMANEEYTQTFLATREIDEEKISDTWLNRHLKYTHGYGVTLSRVDKVTASGQPDVLIGSVPPSSKVEEIDIARPEVYFGELTNDYVIINTDEDEFDYPDGDENAYTRYEGNAGVTLNPVSRALFALRERSMKLLVSSNVNNDSRIIINRNIMDRVNTILPYISYDKDPYMCTVDGKLYWIIDAYTTSSNFPYSQPYSTESSTNYIRNSVKVVIDAYNGDTNYYIVDDTDAIAATYAKIYPKLFKTMDEMPEGVRAHIRYPGTMLDVQASIYEKYHVNDVKVFYQKEDLWDISNEIYGTDEQPMEPNYYIMKLPGEDSEEFVSSIPYTPKDKKNMTGLLVARSDGKNYGQIVLYQLPKSKVVYGPMQVEAMIDQSTEISKEFSLWNSSGSKYSRGNMFVIPIEDSLLYVEPVYLEATNSSIPEVKRVIVVYGDKIAYESTLAECLASLFGEGTGNTETVDVEGDDNADNGDSEKKTKSQAELIQDAQDAYDDAQDALKDGDWSKYGEHMDELEDILQKLK